MTVRLGAPVFNRVKPLAAFLAIVWGVAASFVAFESATISGFSWLAEPGGALADLALPAAVKNSRLCRADGNPSVPRHRFSPDNRAAAWMLGTRMGLFTRANLLARDTARPPGDPQSREWVAAQRRFADGTAADVERLSAALNVPRPPVFTPVNQATINIEFVPFVEGADNSTGRALAVGYGSDACELYKMGAYWGFSMWVRTALPGEPNIYAREINYYARRLGLPESLWRPLIARTPANASGPTLAAEVDAATDSVTAHLQRAPESGSGAKK
jgi:hypothetical protein